ncbi:beta-1,3-galactosyl-o-glycosyl-glycoprotein beta-1,6-n-acetylglucosaminyltransferase 3-like [Plakobranchus ocellatus]|uniref:Beta-1,3-galactosyl-o-glycosyl-glycoprotein beta-1,6-n-acetylglucosaminyltransferase 3-like n=1 Tax=Plakobranchus ocellatus TaxID=259542 RepID=A0AAV3YD60_9GAST|nr:beta-1,3-galactosyl-o-glycosyl-glycoprotein beta-1,6-n-acetylglucosaminyltransferase 3-like [Plakobranchus ocellatus]
MIRFSYAPAFAATIMFTMTIFISVSITGSAHAKSTSKQMSFPKDRQADILSMKKMTRRRLQLVPQHSERRVDCAAIIDGDVVETLQAVRLSSNLRNQEPGMLPKEYIQRTRNCSKFLSSRGYIISTLSQEEADFPIAFSILVHTDIEMAERMLRAIYRPENYYCIHVDEKSTEIYKAVRQIADCFSNVVLATKRVQVKWASFSALEADLICMQTLWRFRKWKYLINLTGQEFPLKTNADLVRILRSLNGSNDVHSTLHETYAEQRRFGNNSLPSWFRPIKGSVHVTLSRAFVDFLLHDQKAVSILNWAKSTESFHDEIFFSTLNHNPQLQAPGSYRGEHALLVLDRVRLLCLAMHHQENGLFAAG